jgi:hypothetical protein
MSTAAKFCKVCFDAGKTDKEYTSHYVRRDREPNSPVVCPTLLKQECGFCGQAGHSPKYCTVLEEKKKQEAKRVKLVKKQLYQQKQEQVKVQEREQQSAAKKGKQNVFAALYDSDEEEQVKPQIKKIASVPEQPEQLKKDQFPALQQAAAAAKQSAKPAAVASNNAWLKSLQQSCPNLTVPKQMPKETYVNSATQPKATLVRRNNKEEAQAQACPVPSLVSDFIEEEEEEHQYAVAPMPRFYLKASELDWAAEEEEDDSDEDW